MSFHRQPDGHWWIRVGSWTIGPGGDVDRDWRPLSERYGTTRTWWLGPLRIVRWGRITIGALDLDAWTATSKPPTRVRLQPGERILTRDQVVEYLRTEDGAP